MTPRTVAIACVVMIWCAPLLRAQPGAGSAPLIEWSADRALTIEDFTAKVPARTTSASLSLVAIEASWECVGGSAASRARAVFDPSRSWWRQSGGVGDRALLAHRWLVEQKQYDKETANGFDAARQKTWSKKVAEALREL